MVVGQFKLPLTKTKHAEETKFSFYIIYWRNIKTEKWFTITFILSRKIYFQFANADPIGNYRNYTNLNFETFLPLVLKDLLSFHYITKFIIHYLSEKRCAFLRWKWLKITSKCNWQVTRQETMTIADDKNIAVFIDYKNRNIKGNVHFNLSL